MPLCPILDRALVEKAFFVVLLLLLLLVSTVSLSRVVVVKVFFSFSVKGRVDGGDDDDDDDDKVYNDDDDASYEAKGVVSRTSNRTSVMYLSANAVPVARSRTLRVLSLVNCFSQNAI